MSTALGVIDEAGVHGLSLRGLARSIGVSAPAIYAHFPNVDAILLAVARQLFADLAARLSAAAGEAPDPPARLRAVCQAYLDHAEDHPGRYLVMFGGQWDVTAAVEQGAVDGHATHDLGHDVTAVFVHAVRDPDDPGTAPDEADVTAAVATWLVLHGYAHQRLVARAFRWPLGTTEAVLDRATAPRRLPPPQDPQRHRPPPGPHLVPKGIEDAP